MSVMGARWIATEVSSAQVEALVADGMHPVVARCVAQRFPGTPAQTLFQPSLDHLHDPRSMFRMEEALERLRRAESRGEHVRIITDYDVDGTTSSLILQAALGLAGGRATISYHIPNRFEEGYGFSVIAARKAIEDGVDLVVTADIGVRDHAAVAEARSGGVDVLVCDHHLPPGADVPQDAIVLCPPQATCSYPNQSLAACGVSLKLAQGLLKDHPRHDDIVRSMLKLAAIGTVADLVSLATAENRAIVALGLQQLNQGRHHPGLRALVQVSDLTPGQITETSLGFRIGPRINAAGRLDDASLVVELLNCRDPGRANALAAQIDQLNSERKNIQRTLVDLALKQAGATPGSFVVVSGPEEQGWHRGVVGIVASRLKDELYRPCAVVSIQGDVAVGSIRSVSGVHAVEALDSVSDLMTRYGGHPAAAGFTLPADRLDAFRERLCAYVDGLGQDTVLQRTCTYDADVVPGQLDDSLEQQLASLGPFGMGNPRPRLVVRQARLHSGRLLASGKLLKMRMEASAAEVIWWSGAPHQSLLEQGPVDLLGKLDVNHWKGRRTLQFVVTDARSG